MTGYKAVLNYQNKMRPGWMVMVTYWIIFLHALINQSDLAMHKKCCNNVFIVSIKYFPD